MSLEVVLMSLMSLGVRFCVFAAFGDAFDEFGGAFDEFGRAPCGVGVGVGGGAMM